LFPIFTAPRERIFVEIKIRVKLLISEATGQMEFGNCKQAMNEAISLIQKLVKVFDEFRMNLDCFAKTPE
jgi:hypothetical protein